jgi:hypothetical protein
MGTDAPQQALQGVSLPPDPDPRDDPVLMCHPTDVRWFDGARNQRYKLVEAPYGNAQSPSRRG